MSPQGNENSKDWKAVGVRAHVPAQKSGIEVEIVEKDYGDPPDTPEFTVIRRLVNFEVVQKGTSNPVGRFAPPLRITACYTQADADAAGGENKLRLGAWDKTAGKWRILPHRPIGDCPFTGAGFIGAVEVLWTDKWADPSVAWA